MYVQKPKRVEQFTRKERFTKSTFSIAISQFQLDSFLLEEWSGSATATPQQLSPSEQ
jgi:hypothetical protein